MKNWSSIAYLAVVLGIPVYQLLFGRKKEPTPGYRATPEEVKTQAPVMPAGMVPPPAEPESANV